MIAPLLEVQFRDGPEPSFENIQAIVATSANGMRALVRRTERRDLPVFAVGAQTANEAFSSGFSDVKNSDGDSRELADAIASWASPHRGLLFHASGDDVGGKLASRLSEHGFRLRREVLYDVVPVKALPAIAHDAIQEGQADAIILYSPRSAEVFVRCVKAAALQEKIGAILAVCISKMTASKAEGLPFREIRIASRPAEDKVLETLGS